MTTLKFKDSKGFFGTEGSGNQRKYWTDRGGSKYLVKINSKYREASKECSVSKILDLTKFEHVRYGETKVIIGSKVYNGCICKSFLNNDDEAISLYKVLEGIQISKKTSTNEYFRIVVDAIQERLGLSKDSIIEELIKIATIDFIVMNPDRHLNNIEFIFNSVKGEYRFSPLYDFGKSFLNRDGRMSLEDFERESYKFKTMPFSTNPKKNLINIEKAKDIARYMKRCIGDIMSLSIPEFHKLVVRKRIDKLLSY